MTTLMVCLVIISVSMMILFTGGRNVYTFVSFEPQENKRNGMMTLEKKGTPTRLERLLGSKIETTNVQYVGGCTVWHHYPSWKRCDLFTEVRLSDYWSRWERNNAAAKQDEGGVQSHH